MTDDFGRRLHLRRVEFYRRQRAGRLSSRPAALANPIHEYFDNHDAAALVQLLR